MGVGLGQATITATAHNGISATTLVTVREPVALIVLKTEDGLLSYRHGTVVKLIADVLPETAAKRTVIYKSSDRNLATVSADGMVTLKRAGTVKITARAADGSGVTRSIKIRIKK